MSNFKCADLRQGFEDRRADAYFSSPGTLRFIVSGYDLETDRQISMDVYMDRASANELAAVIHAGPPEVLAATSDVAGLFKKFQVGNYDGAPLDGSDA